MLTMTVIDLQLQLRSELAERLQELARRKGAEPAEALADVVEQAIREDWIHNNPSDLMAGAVAELIVLKKKVSVAEERLASVSHELAETNERLKGRLAVVHNLQISYLDQGLAEALAHEAMLRKITLGALCRQVLATVANDRLFNAVLEED